MKFRIAVLLGMISYLLIHGALSYRLPAGSGCSIIVFFYHSRLDPIIVMAFLFVENQTDASTNSRALLSLGSLSRRVCLRARSCSPVSTIAFIAHQEVDRVAQKYALLITDFITLGII